MVFPAITLPQDQMTLPGTKTFLHWFVWLFRNGLKIAGVIGLLALDVYTGPYFMGGLNSTGSPQIAATFWCFSLALVAVQMGLWDYAIKQLGRNTFLRWQTWLPVVGAMIFMIIDTLLDIGFVTQLLDPEAGPREVFASTENRDLVWWMLAIGIPGLCLIFEPMMMWLLRKDRSPNGPTRLFDQDTEPNIPKIPGEPLVGND